MAVKYFEEWCTDKDVVLVKVCVSFTNPKLGPTYTMILSENVTLVAFCLSTQ